MLNPSKKLDPDDNKTDLKRNFTVATFINLISNHI